MHWEVFAGTICQLMLTAVVKHMVISYREPLCQMCNVSRWRLLTGPQGCWWSWLLEQSHLITLGSRSRIKWWE